MLGSGLLALILMGIVLLALGLSVFGTYGAMLDASFASRTSLTLTLANSAPLVFTGLAVALVFPIRVYNIGGEGQLYLGALAASGVALWMGHEPAVVLVSGMIAGGIIGGLAWVAVPTILRVTLGTNEIVTTLMLNYVAGLLLTYLIFDSSSFWRDTSPGITYPAPKVIPSAAEWPTVGVGGVTVPAACLIGIVFATLMYVVIRHTRMGFEFRIVSFSLPAARYINVSTRTIVLVAFLLSGALAGLAGAVQVGTVTYALDPVGLQAAQFGYAGIVVAAIAAFHPLAVLPSALFLGGLINSGAALQGQGFPAGLVGTMEGIILLCVVSAGWLVAYEVRIRKSRPDSPIARDTQEPLSSQTGRPMTQTSKG